jgi:hypothetical protein
VILRRELWVFWHVLGALVAAAALDRLGVWREGRAVKRPSAGRGRAFRRAVSVLAGAGTLGLMVPMARECYEVGVPNPSEPRVVEIGGYIRARLPANTAILVEPRFAGEERVMAFYADRTCYGLTEDWREAARLIRAAGGLPYIASTRSLNLAEDYRSADGWKLYRCPPTDSAASPH